MALAEIATGGVGLADLMRLRELDEQFDEGDRGAIQFKLREPIPEDMLTTFVHALEDGGLQMWDTVKAEGTDLWVFFTKAIPPLPVIIAIIALIIGLLIGWILFKEVGIGGLGASLLIGGAILLGGLVLLNRLTR